MDQKTINEHVSFVQVQGPKAQAMAIVSLDVDGRVSIQNTGNLLHLSFLSDQLKCLIYETMQGRGMFKKGNDETAGR